jgi:hypothetical protein
MTSFHVSPFTRYKDKTIPIQGGVRIVKEEDKRNNYKIYKCKDWRDNQMFITGSQHLEDVS